MILTERIEISKIEALEKIRNAIAVLLLDVVLAFLLESDRSANKSDGGSLYQFAYSHPLRRQTACQLISSMLIP